MKLLNRIADWFYPGGKFKNKAKSEWDDYWYTVPFGITPETTSGAAINEVNALNLTPVWACVKIISEDVASLPLHLYEEMPNGNKQKATGHYMFDMLYQSPNPEMTAISFRETMMSHVLTWGNAFAEIERNGTNMITALWPLPPNRMNVLRGNNGELYYEYNPDRSEKKILRKEQVLHIPGLSYNGIVGYSPIGKLREAIGLAAAAEEFGARFFGSGTNMGLVVKHPGKLSPEAAKHLRDSLATAYSGLGKSHRLMVLQEAMDVEKIGIPPEDAQFLETRQFQLAEIARIYRVPLHMVSGDVERAKGWSTLEQQSLEYVKFCLRPWLVRLEQNYKKQLGVQKRYYWKHNIEGLLRADLKARKEYYEASRQWGWLSVNEIRELEDLNPIPEKKGGRYLEPMNMKEAGEEMPEPKPIDKGNGEDKLEFEARCLNCKKILFRGEGDITIKCPKCGIINQFTNGESQAFIAA